jgi:hypothetical protein
VQRNLEDAMSALYPGRILLCDRGTVDGAAYWPANGDDYFSASATTIEDELGRYDAVLFFESAAVGGISIEGGNRYRVESNDAALELDQRLRALWSSHPRFHLVPHHNSFLHTITMGLAILESLLGTMPEVHP